MTDFSGRVVIVTGGGKGIGRETARAFASAGASVVITGRTREALDRTAAELETGGRRVLAVTADVAVEEDCRRTVDTALAAFGRIDILINNAGMSARGSFDTAEPDLYRTLIGINFLGAVMMSRFSLESVTAVRGSIVFISTLAGMKGLPGLSHYASSKIPLTAFSESIREELRPAGVHVGIIYVGFTDNDPDKTILDSRGNRIPLNRTRNSMTREQVAQAVLRVVRKRREITVLSVLGKMAALIWRFFPRLSARILAGATMRSPMYRP